MRLPRGVRRAFRLGEYRTAVRREVADELDFHFDRTVEELVRRGLTRREAEREALARFGDVTAYRRTLEGIQRGRARMRMRSDWLDTTASTVRGAARALTRSPGFTVAIVVILALGIGANAVMFGVVDRLLLRPPQHVDDWEQVRHLYVHRRAFNGEIRTGRMLTFPDYRDFGRVAGWNSVAAYASMQPLTMGRGSSARRVRTVKASASLFHLLGVQPLIGRFYRDEEDAPGAVPTAVLGEEFWEREFGADEAVLGRALDIGRGSYTVIGVAPKGFTGAELEPVDVWLPLQTTYALEEGHAEWRDARGWWWLKVVARLAEGATDGATTAQATALHLAGRADRIEAGEYDGGAEILAAPIIAARGPDPSSEADVARWLAGVSLVVLLIACFNVANMLLARGIRARREVAVRLALGVSRARLFGQVLTESVLLAGLGGAAALLVARLSAGPLHRILLPDVAFDDGGLGPRLVAFVAVAVLLAAVLAGLVPGIQASRPDVAGALREGGRGVVGGGSRLRTALLVGQAALSVVLLVGAGLFVRSLERAQRLDLGYDPGHVAVIGLEWNETLPAPERAAIYHDLLARVRRQPRVFAAGLTYLVPFEASITVGQPAVPGRDSIPRHRNGGPYFNKVGSGFFEAMGLEISKGRAFGPDDAVEGAPPVTILTESMASAIWPNEDPIGRCMLFGDAREDGAPCTTVVGVVENHRRQALVEDDEFLYYVNQTHPEFRGPPQRVIAGTRGPARALVPALKTEADATSPLVRFARVYTLQELVEPQLRSWKLGASMFSLFGALALAVAGWGLFSVLAFDVALRRHEIGVRSALGAGAGRLLRLVVRRAVTLTAVGVGLGLVAAFGAARFVEPLLFEVSPRDPAIYGGVGLVLLGVAVLASTLPGLRAVRVDPTEVLRSE